MGDDFTCMTQAEAMRFEMTEEHECVFPAGQSIIPTGITKRELFFAVAMHAIVSSLPLASMNREELDETLYQIGYDANRMAKHMCTFSDGDEE